MFDPPLFAPTKKDENRILTLQIEDIHIYCQKKQPHILDDVIEKNIPTCFVSFICEHLNSFENKFINTNKYFLKL